MTKKIENPFWKRFRKNRLAFTSTILFLALLFLSASASIVANDRPIVMTYNGGIYFPSVIDYVPNDFGLEGFVVDYYESEEKFEKNGWMIWPPILQKPFEPNLNFDTLPAPPGSKSVVSASDEFPGKKIKHALGTDYGGRDLITRLIYGCRTSLLMAIAITSMSLVLGVILGSLMGFFGGLFDLFVGRLLETLGYFPVIFMIIILVAFLDTPSLAVMSIIFAILGISPFAFYMRGQVLATRKQTFVEAATAIGQVKSKIMFKHILPNAFSPILVLIPFTITSNISFLATIDFLGFGVQPPTASLGAILRSGYEDIENRWWLILYSSIVLITILLLVNFIGDGVRDGMDPHATVSKREFKAWTTKLKAARASL
jgi:microcin C transport system permease protein